MFAVIVLGIGFIMLAAVFPVAIQQSKNTVDETTAAAIAQSGAATMEKALVPLPTSVQTTQSFVGTYFTLSGENAPQGGQLAPGATAPRRGKAIWLRDKRMPAPDQVALWGATAGNLIQSNDPRFAYVPFLIRDIKYTGRTGAVDRDVSSFAQLVVIAVQARNKPIYDAKDIGDFLPATVTPPPGYYNLEPRPLYVQMPALDSAGNLVANTIALSNITTTPLNPTGTGWVDSVSAASEGAVVIISDDRILVPAAPATPTSSGRINGRTYRLGVRRQELDSANGNKVVWELTPGSEFSTGQATSADPGAPFRADPGVDGVVNTADDIYAIGYQTPKSPPGVTASSVRCTDANGAIGCVIGREFKDLTWKSDPPNNPGGFAGGAQEISVYTTFIRMQ